MNVDSVTHTLDIQGISEDFMVHEVTGAEGINMLYSFELLASSHASSIDFDAVVGKPAVLAIERGEHRRHVHGIVGAIEQTDTAESRTVYRMTLVPPAWLLSQGKRYRILQGLTTPQVVARVLDEAGLRDRYRLSLQGSYAPRDVCVQYGEPDWAFISRLLEDEGIFYFFDHTEAGVTLVLADHPGVHEPIGQPAEIPYAPAAGALTGGERVLSFRFASRIRPGKVAVLDIPFDTPTRRVEAEAQFTRDTDVELCAYPSSASAQGLLDALQVSRSVGSGTANSVRLRPGVTFKLTGHLRQGFDTGYLVSRVQHSLGPSGEGGDAISFTTTFDCLPQGTPCRPEPITPKPRITGPQPALVVGPPGSEIHVDDKGRVLVKLEWDKSAATDLTSACWAPVSQISSGAGWGSVILPRVGSYVLVEFMNGDAERPIVSGRVYNSLSPYPYALPQSKTKSTLKSHTTPGGGGYSELRFEDQKGSEQVYLRSQRDLDVEALHDATRKVGHDDKVEIAGSRHVKVSGAETEIVSLAQSVTVGAVQTIAVAGARTVTVGAEQKLTVAGDHRESVGGDHVSAVAGSEKEEIDGSWARVIGEDSVEEIAGNRGTEIGGSARTLIAGSEVREVAGNQSVAVDGNLQEIVDGSVSLTHGALAVAVMGKTALKGADEVKIESEKAMKIGSPEVYVSGDRTVYIRAYEKITLEVTSASGDEDAESAKIEITTDGVYLTSGSARKKLTGDKIHFNT